MKHQLVGLALAVLAAGCPMMRSQPYTTAEGDIEVTIENSTLPGVCTFEIGGAATTPNTKSWDPLAGREIKIGHSEKIGVKHGMWSVRVEACDHRSAGSLVFEVNGPMTIAVMPPGPKSPLPIQQVVRMFPNARPRAYGPGPQEQPGKPNCAPAGDETVPPEGCCSGRLVMSYKHGNPNVSHCAYDDE